MNISINCNSLADMSAEKFALLTLRLMAIAQIPSGETQAPSANVQRATVQTGNKGPKEAQYNALFNKSLRITDNPAFNGKTREEIAEMCIQAGRIAGEFSSAVYSIPQESPQELMEVDESDI